MNVWRHKEFRPAYFPATLRSIVLRTRTGACWRIMSDDMVLASGTARNKSEARLLVRQARKEMVSRR